MIKTTPISKTRILLFALVVLLGIFPVIQTVSAQSYGGATITVNAGQELNVNQDWSNTNSGSSAAFDNSGTLNFGANTITNTSGQHRIVYTRDGGVTNFNGTTINLADGNSGGPLILAMSGTAEINFNGVTMTQLGSYDGVIMRAPGNYQSGGKINFSGTNTFKDIQPKNNGNMSGGIRNGSEFIVKDGTTTFENCVLQLQDGGVYTIQSGAELVFKGTTLVPNNNNATEPLFVVKSGATLSFTESSKLDLSKLGGRPAIKVEEGGKLVVDGSDITGANGSNNSAFVIVEGGELEVKNQGRISENTNSGQGKIISVSGGKVTAENGFFGSNNVRSGGAAMFVENAEVTIDHTFFSGNSANNGGAIRAIDSTLTISGQSVFDSNTARAKDSYVGGGAIHATSSEVTILGSEFTNNTASLVGGAYLQDGGTLVLGEEGGADNTYPTFSQNSVTVEYKGTNQYSRARGGAVAVEIYCDTDADRECNTFETLEMTVNNAIFESNTATFQGGALSIGYNPFTGGKRGVNAREEVNVEIKKGQFLSNSVTNNAWDGIAGGAVMIFANGSLRMKNAAIINNSCNGAGAGIASCNTGYDKIYIYNGAAIFENFAEYANTRDMDDVYIMNNETNPVLSDQMFNGGSHQWDLNKQVINRRNAVTQKVTTGTYYGSTPTDKNIDDVRVLFQNNTATGYVDPDWYPEENYAPLNGNGGAIGNNGNLYIGAEEPETVTATVTKIWSDAEHEDARITPVEFVSRYLVVLADGQDMGLTFTQSGEPVDNIYTFVADGGIVLTLTDNGAEYSVEVSGLPVKNEDGQDIVYAFDERAISNYEKSVSEDGLTITNTFTEEEPPTPPTPPTPPDTPWEFFPFEELPRTGFSALRPTALSARPNEISYKPQGLTLQIPSLDVSEEIVTVPFVDNEYPVEWLDNSIGMLEGSAKPGEGWTILTGHNTLNTMEAGPFAFLSYLEEGDIIFVLNKYNELKPFTVYASQKIDARDSASLEAIAKADSRSLTLITCEDELVSGGYQNRRIVAARPMGW